MNVKAFTQTACLGFLPIIGLAEAVLLFFIMPLLSIAFVLFILIPQFLFYIGKKGKMKPAYNIFITLLEIVCLVGLPVVYYKMHSTLPLWFLGTFGVWVLLFIVGYLLPLEYDD